MRVLFQTAALLVLTQTACMSSNARFEESAPLAAAIDKSSSPAVDYELSDASGASSPEATRTPTETASETEKEPCDDLKKNVELPSFLKETPALVIHVDQSCKKNAKGDEVLVPKFSAIGVSCTGGPGLVARKGHSNQNWEVITFGMDLSCPMKPAEDVRQMSKKQFGFDVEPSISAFIPLMIEFWEFEQNNDAGIGTNPTLTASGGGAQQWNKGVQKNVTFPIKLYGHSSSWGKDVNVYEARAVIHPRTNQRQFDVTVVEMKELSSDELKSTLDRCMSKTGQRSACNEAFATQ